MDYYVPAMEKQPKKKKGEKKEEKKGGKKMSPPPPPTLIAKFQVQRGQNNIHQSATWSIINSHLI